MAEGLTLEQFRYFSLKKLALKIHRILHFVGKEEQRLVLAQELYFLY